MKYVSYYLSHISNSKRVEVLQCVLMYGGLGARDFPWLHACDSLLISWLTSRKTEPKEIHCCLISHQHVVFTLQLQIWVTAQHMALGFRSKHRIGCTARPGGQYFETGLRVKIKRKKGNKYLPFVWKPGDSRENWNGMVPPAGNFPEKK